MQGEFELRAKSSPARAPLITRKQILMNIARYFVMLALAAMPSVWAQTWHVDATYTNAANAGEGSSERPFPTISAASVVAKAGDTVLVRPGVYRERVAPAFGGEKDNPIMYKASERGKAIVKGSDVFAPHWEPVDGAASVFRASLNPAWFSGDNPFHRSISIEGNDTSTLVRPTTQGEPREVLGEVFVEGAPYAQLTSRDAVLKRERSWMVPPEGGALLVHFREGVEPSKTLVEITVRDRIFAPHRRGLGYIHVEGFVFEHCANQGPFPQSGAVSVRSGHDWIIEGNTIRFAATIGLDCGSEYWDGTKIPDTAPEDRRLIIGGRHLIQDNDVTDNGLTGIAGWNHHDTRIIGNRVERNNRLKFPHGKGWEEWAGIKLHGTNAVIQGNYVSDNLAFGIWIDNGYGDARIDSNIVLRNQRAGIFLELGGTPGHPCLITNNVVGGSTGEDFYPGVGIYTHDASDMIVAHNLIFDNASFGVLMRTITTRQFGGKLVETSRNRIVNNIFVNNAKGAISLPYPNVRSTGLVSEHNVFCADAPAAKVVFAVNKYQDVFKMADVAEALIRKQKELGIPGEPSPDAATWIKTPELTLKQWQMVMGLDRESEQIKLALRFDNLARPMRLQITLDDRLLSVPCVAVDGIDKDLLGHVYTKNKVIVGPLQELKAGENSVDLAPSPPLEK